MNREIVWVVSFLTVSVLVFLTLTDPKPMGVSPAKDEVLPQQQVLAGAVMPEEAQRQHIEELLKAGGTSIVVGTPASEYVPGDTPNQALADEIVSNTELDGNGVTFVPLEATKIRGYQLLFGEKFAYLTSNIVDGKTVVSFDFFSNPDLADYLLTKEGQLNFFLVNGDESVAKENVKGWCLAGDRVCINFGN